LYGGGYVSVRGYNIIGSRTPIELIQSVGMHAATGVSCHSHRGKGTATTWPGLPEQEMAVGATRDRPRRVPRRPVKGELDWKSIPGADTLLPDAVVDKPGKGSFVGTNLDPFYEVGAFATFRSASQLTWPCIPPCNANDMATNAIVGRLLWGTMNHYAALRMIKMQGVFDLS
jgi:hypothetical protein